MIKDARGISLRTLSIEIWHYASSIDVLPKLTIIISQLVDSGRASGITAITVHPMTSAHVSSKRVIAAWRTLFVSTINSSGFSSREWEVRMLKPSPTTRHGAPHRHEQGTRRRS
jgi:hypothetical protein